MSRTTQIFAPVMRAVSASADLKPTSAAAAAPYVATVGTQDFKVDPHFAEDSRPHKRLHTTASAAAAAVATVARGEVTPVDLFVRRPTYPVGATLTSTESSRIVFEIPDAEIENLCNMQPKLQRVSGRDRWLDQKNAIIQELYSKIDLGPNFQLYIDNLQDMPAYHFCHGLLQFHKKALLSNQSISCLIRSDAFLLGSYTQNFSTFAALLIQLHEVNLWGKFDFNFFANSDFLGNMMLINKFKIGTRKNFEALILYRHIEYASKILQGLNNLIFNTDSVSDRQASFNKVLDAITIPLEASKNAFEEGIRQVMHDIAWFKGNSIITSYLVPTPEITCRPSC